MTAAPAGPGAAAGDLPWLEDADPCDMRLPPAPIARPGERVLWHAEARPMAGLVLGYDAHGEAIVRDDFGIRHHREPDMLRLEDPFERLPPNWCRLPPGGRLLRPGTATEARFEQILGQRIPPGPSYGTLALEVWGRGFEIYLVGGTVRDVLAGTEGNDVDMVTTMPLTRMTGFVEATYRTWVIDHGRGHLRIGGSPASADPFVDVNLFEEGGEFADDVAQRDFACNAVYYDPVNRVLADPTGTGVADCRERRLRLVHGSHSPLKMGQIFIRAVKLTGRGFAPDPESRATLIGDYLPMLGMLEGDSLLSYFEYQVLSPHRGSAARQAAASQFRDGLAKLGCPSVWAEHLAGIEARL